MNLRGPEHVFQIIEPYRAKLKALRVCKLGLFGSSVGGEVKETSDLDFIVDLEHKAFKAYMDLKAFLEDLFEAEVDLVLPDAVKPRLRKIILGETVCAPGF